MTGDGERAGGSTAALASFIFAALLFLGAATASFADAPTTIDGSAIVITPGERVVMKLDPSAAPTIVSLGLIPATETQPGAKLDHAYETVVHGPVAGSPPKRDELTLSLWSTPAGGTVLNVGNGYPYPVIYKAWLVFERNGERSYRATSICPVRPGLYGFETWGGTVAGVAVSAIVGVDPQHMTCNGGSVLTVGTPGAAAGPQYACLGSPTPGQPSPLGVVVLTDSTGAANKVLASWSLSRGDGLHTVRARIDYPMLGDKIIYPPAGIQLALTLGLTPPPAAKTADIVLLLNGVEKARRPWRAYAQQMAALANAPQKKVVGMFGIIPFNRTAEDAGLTDFLTGLGAPGATMTVRVVGDDGSILQEASLPVADPPVRSQVAVDAALNDALTKAKTPTTCQTISK